MDDAGHPPGLKGKTVNPLELIYSWQTCVIVFSTIALTEATKRAIDFILGRSEAADPSLRAVVRTGADLRHTHPAVSQLLLPTLPLDVAVLLALVVPIRPPALLLYTTTQTLPLWFACVAWGIFCGAAADYIFTRVHDARRAFRTRAG